MCEYFGIGTIGFKMLAFDWWNLGAEDFRFKMRARRGRFLVGICVSVRKHVLKLTVGLWEIIAKTALVGLQKNWRLL